jgi:nicotinamide mononucleotide transporter
VSRVKPLTGALLLGAVAAITVALTWLLRRYTNSTVPVLDSLITALSLVAQFMMTRKWIENWLVWITANCLSVGLLIYKGLYVTSALYLLYQVLCVMGLLTWRRALKPEPVPSPG